MGVLDSISKSQFVTTLRHPNYAKLLIGQVIAAFGDRIYQTALLSFAVLKGNTSKYSADIMFWTILPSILLSPFTVALIDRLDRRRAMLASDIGRAFLVGVLPFMMALISHHYLIYAFAFLLGSFGALFAPCRLAIIPNLGPRELLMSANAITSQAGTVATLIAMPIAGWIVDHWGTKPSFFINSLTFLASAFSIWLLRPTSNISQQTRTLIDPWGDFQKGFQYIWNNRSVFVYVLFTGLTQCLVAIFFVCFLSYGTEVVGHDSNEKIFVTTLLFLAIGVGMAIGVLWLTCFSKLAERFIFPILMLSVAGIGIFALGFVVHPWIAAGILVCIGFPALLSMAPVDAFLQKNVPDEIRGRVFAARGILVGAAFLSSLQFSKGIIHQLGIPHTLNLLGAASIVCGIFTACVAALVIGKEDRNRVS
jgi:MFS family permease